MPLPNFANLQAQPSLLLDWLRSNLLLPSYIQNVNNPPGTDMVTITDPPGNPPARAVTPSGMPVGVYRIVNNNHNALNGGNQLPAYICNYARNAVNGVDLASLGDYCFTVTLNGCTFGIGPAGVGGRRHVAHANQGGNTLLQRVQIQTEFGVGPNLAGLTLLEPAQYRRLSDVLAMQATVFGIREGTTWRFYFQSFSHHGGADFRLYGVFPII